MEQSKKNDEVLNTTLEDAMLRIVHEIITDPSFRSLWENYITIAYKQTMEMAAGRSFKGKEDMLPMAITNALIGLLCDEMEVFQKYRIGGIIKFTDGELRRITPSIRHGYKYDFYPIEKDEEIDLNDFII